MSGHIYTVEFRIYSKMLDPIAISRELGLEPSQIAIKGEPAPGGREWRSSMWAYDGGEKRSEWNSLEDGINYLLEKLSPRRTAIARYESIAELVWWCGHFQSSLDGGPMLSPELLKRLGDFGASLYIDNYFSSPEDATVDVICPA